MRRYAPVLLLLLGAAGPQPQGPILLPAMSMQSLMPRQAAPSAPAPVFQPAPMPDQDAAAPVTISKAQAEFAPTVFSGTKKQFRGDGFTSNSTSQVSEERKMKPIGGFALTMPLQ